MDSGVDLCLSGSQCRTLVVVGDTGRFFRHVMSGRRAGLIFVYAVSYRYIDRFVYHLHRPGYIYQRDAHFSLDHFSDVYPDGA